MQTELILPLGIEIADVLGAAHALETADRFRRYCDFGSARMYPKPQEPSFWYVGGVQDRCPSETQRIVWPGQPYPLGSTWDGEGVNFALYSERGESGTLPVRQFQVGNFPVGWTEWNDLYRDTVRAYWKGDGGLLGDQAYRITGSSDLYTHSGRRPYASIPSRDLWIPDFADELLIYPRGDLCGDPITQVCSHAGKEITLARLTGSWSILRFAPFGQVGLNA